MKTFKSLVSAGVVTAALIVGAAASSPAFASEGLIKEPSKHTNQGGSSPLLDQLEELAETQSEAEVQELFDSGVPAEFLVDTSGAEWELVAGIAKENVIQPFALQVVGPGCSGTSMCLMNAYPNGYTGTGTLNGSWKNVHYIAAGDRKGRFQSAGGSGTILQPGVAFNLSPKVHFTQIQRY